ncbi:MAG TPA: RNA methyltransferase [Leucothrix mucor]|nr:RNA methyltransferase [Leucothrix mucor]
MLDNIRIVMVRTFHAGNIGSAVRSMKTMGLSQLYLVEPRDFPSDEATKMAAGAITAIEQVIVVDSLRDAVKDCSLVIASTARVRGDDLPELYPEKMAKALLVAAKKAPVALIFGPERMGLHNDDLILANYRVTIPTNPDYSSLNIAMAVQTLSYEIYKQFSADTIDDNDDHLFARELPNAAEFERFYLQLEETLTETGFIIKNHPGKVMQRFRNLFSRAELDAHEMGILRGALASVQRLNKD